MPRLRRFDEHRFVGVRATMEVFDCDANDQFEELSDRVDADDLIGRNGLQSFGPDTLDESRNRGFRPGSVRPDKRPG